MKILAIDFSSDRRSVAVIAEGRCLGGAAESGGRSTHALALIERCLTDAGIEREAIDTVAVGLGPGSYAGIRAAIVTAQAWQLARGVRLLGVSTVECLAAQAQAMGMVGRVHVVIDAQRKEFYLAGYEILPEACRLVLPLQLATEAEVRRCGESGRLLIWPDLQELFAGGQVMFPDAAILGGIASGRSDFVPGEKLEPIYLREPAFVKVPPPRLVPNA